MKTASSTLWLRASGLGLIGLGVGVALWFSIPRPVPPAIPDIPTTTNLSGSPDPTSSATIPPSPPTVVSSPRLPPIDYPPGSVGHACGVNEFPRRVGYWFLEPEQRRQLGGKNPLLAIRNEECSSAVERHLYATNPYLWFDETNNRQFAFINIDNPLTFERLFTDPVGDLVRVQGALARPECQLGENAEPNWLLHETCDADALLNFALITRYCYNEGVRNRTRQMYWEEDNPTPEQDRGMWLQDLEADWIDEKCASLDPILDLQSEVHTELRVQLQALAQDERSNWEGILIELAARLGDDAAALTQTFHRPYKKLYSDDGYKYGHLAGWFDDVFIPSELFVKHPPSVERLRQLVPFFGEFIGARGRKLIKFDHEALVQHLCTPPYYYYTSRGVDEDTIPEPPSCRTIVDTLRQEALHPSDLANIAKFEEVAMRLDVYE